MNKEEWKKVLEMEPRPALVDNRTTQIFTFDFYPYAVDIENEGIEHYRLATKGEAAILLIHTLRQKNLELDEKSYCYLKFHTPNIDDFHGQEDILLITDRDRTINYNGGSLEANTYQCSTCRKAYVFEKNSYNYCPMCGVRFKGQIDISI